MPVIPITPPKDVPWMAGILLCTPQTVWALCRKDMVPHVRVGARLLFNEEVVARWLAAGGSREPGAWRSALEVR